MLQRKPFALVAAAAALSALFVVPTASASAADGPTARELLEKCNNGTDSCVFHPNGEREYFTGEVRTVGAPVFNCTDSVQRSAVSWSDTTSQSNSFGLSMTTEAGFGKVFSVAYEQSYQHTWEESHTESQTTYVDTNPNQVGWVERRPQMERVRGTYELHFEDRFHDHYIWYVDAAITGPAADASAAISQHVRDMTEEEMNRPGCA
ncbi:hypothetical protein [Parasphingorhabdus pacifica]